MRREIAGRDEIELGYHLFEQHWGHGYATEAALACVAHARSLGHTRIVALILPSNLPSQAVARHLGMRPGPRVEWFGLPHIHWELETGGAAGSAMAGDLRRCVRAAPDGYLLSGGGCREHASR